MPYYPYNNYYPYQQNINPYQQQQGYNSQQTPQQPTQQIQQGFVLVQSEQEARAYPVAPGNSITFKDERQPYCYVKTMGFNQLDRPTFEKYRLVKEENAPVEPETPKEDIYATKEELEALRAEFEALRGKKKKEVKDDE